MSLQMKKLKLLRGMSNIMFNLFSERQGIKKNAILNLDEINVKFKNRLWNKIN